MPSFIGLYIIYTKTRARRDEMGDNVGGLLQKAPRATEI